MNPPKPSPQTSRPGTRNRLLSVAGKTILTFSSLGVLGLAAFLAADSARLMQVGLPQDTPSNTRHSTPASHPIETRKSTGLSWPDYPGSKPQKSLLNTLNGVRTLIEERSCKAPAEDVLDFYRREMTARGWADTTAETYHLDPEQSGAGPEAPGDSFAPGGFRSRKAQALTQTLDSTLVVSRGHWSMHITVTEGDAVRQPTLVRIVAVDRPSMEELSLPLMNDVGVISPAGLKEGLTSTSEDQTTRYRTRLRFSERDAASTYKTEVAALCREGWTLLSETSPRGETSKKMGWLSQGGCYVTVSAQHRPDHRPGSLVTVTEARPR